ncbi:MAG: glycogen debranching protein GlgX [Spirochaetales bacterium]|nr:glycogen debranching protein GlgX [Spirochaetales bacterium]
MPHHNAYRVWPGRPYPLGSTWDGSGTNFALFSAHAERVELCLFDDTGNREVARIPLPEYTHQIWHAYLPDVRPGHRYGYRVYGPYAPEEGHRFNHHKLLLDPYARSIRGQIHWHDAVFAYRVGAVAGDLTFDTRDSAPFMPKCEVVDTAFTWGRSPKPETPWDCTVIYEMHPRGFTMRHPAIPDEEKGTFAALANQEILAYLTDLGITAVELLPVHAFARDRHLVERGLTNYWGYNTLGFFAPDETYLNRGLLQDFKSYVQVMHDAGLEVLLDVVYNHTAEGNHLGPHLSFRGIDNRSYYHLSGEDPRYYMDYTGTGNTLNLRHPQVTRLVADSLRYWSDVMKVDGFRFDLAVALARGNDGAYDPDAAFLEVVAQDPLLSGIKLIAEPWDTGNGGYQVGNFPPGWGEWNDRYRDTLRRFWKGDGGVLGELASRISGSSDIYLHRGRRPWASVNYITCHDGFTLRDLVTYNRKRNEANGEENRDGSDHNHSWNCGVEGPTADKKIGELRLRQMRNFIGSLFLSQGVPMMTAGDELGRTQGGNNNAYCQDGPVSWIPWDDLDAEAGDILAFTRRVLDVRRNHIVFRRSRFFHGREIPGTTVRDVTWLSPQGLSMNEDDWNRADLSSLQVLLSGEAGSRFVSDEGRQETDDTFLLILHAAAHRRRFSVPPQPAGRWVLEVASGTTSIRLSTILVEGRSFALYRLAPR